jgi:hypothetical protein
MQIDKDQILQLLRSRGENDKAQQAEQELPGQVDTDQHAGLLSKLGLDPAELIGMLGGGGGAGGALGKLGGLLGNLPTPAVRLRPPRVGAGARDAGPDRFVPGRDDRGRGGVGAGHGATERRPAGPPGTSTVPDPRSSLMARNTLSRSMHDLGLAAWFGGTLANAVALNPAAAEAGSDSRTGAVANAGWDRWTPVNAVAIGMHVVGSVGQLIGNRARVAQQEGVGQMSVLKTALTAAALGVTAYSRVLGQRVSAGGATPSKRGTRPSKRAKADVAVAQAQLESLQWVVPALTGALVVVSSYAGEQQRPSEVARGIAQKS